MSTLLTHPDVVDAIRGGLRSRGCRQQDLEDGIQDVYVKALTCFRRIPAPTELADMMALCAKIARDQAVDELRRAATRRRDAAAKCDPDAYRPLEYGVERRDPVDAGRQLEVLAQLFREGRMPEHGVDILEGVASRCTHEEIGADLGITDRAVENRLDTMRRVYRARLARLGMLPWMVPLRAIASTPDAIATLRRAA